MKQLTKCSLSPARQRLLELMQELNFGQLQNLVIVQGEPQWMTPPLIIKDWKLDGDNEQRIERHLNDFALKQHHQNLFAIFETIRNGTITEIQIRNGLPCRVMTSQPIA